MSVVKIGNEVIYPEQHKTSKKLVAVLFDYDYSAFLDAECQQGKTGVCIDVVNDYLKRAIKQRKSLHCEIHKFPIALFNIETGNKENMK